MKKFSDLGIKNEDRGFVGDKIKPTRIFNREVQVLDYKIVKSKYEGRCLHMQIQLGETKHIVFSASENLMQMLEKTKPDDFPFLTTIIEDNDRHVFT